MVDRVVTDLCNGVCVECACALFRHTAVQCGRRLADGRTLPLPVPAQRLVTADAGAQSAVAGGVGGVVVVVVSCAAPCRFRAVLVSAVSTQQLPRAKVPRHCHCHRWRAALQTVSMAVTGATAQEGLCPLPVTECREDDDDKSVNGKLGTNLLSGGQSLGFVGKFHC